MLSFLYNTLTALVGLILRVIAPFHHKIGLFVKGRKTVFSTLKQHISAEDRVIWFHTASLGEFEQGLPVIERVKAACPGHKILVTFFSPSGYEVKKNSRAADIITYLPLDTRKNVNTFLSLAHPELAIFVKYEFWPNYLEGLRKRHIPAILISGIFRKNQLFFKPYGAFMRQSLHTFRHFFVQDENSAALLKNIGIDQVTVSGDTRMDRVAEILHRDNTLGFMEHFKGDHLCFVAGSTWPEDEALLLPLIAHAPETVKFVIAPHNIKTAHNAALQRNIPKKAVLYSEMDHNTLPETRVLIIDTIGLLTRIYHYADMAYVGGAVGNTGLHNILEPAVFGIPVIIGPHFEKFREARELVKLGGVSTISNQEQFLKIFNQLVEQESTRAGKGEINYNYIKKNTGAVIQILEFVRICINV
ncbi:3-deoxy-D-manno-octulosonic acid transferase [Sinomicrobium soli]|uniref:3-deoxy-D-manno-octulosonic acid transferase n=1 Tax=Sinomicrobium sp. N-1-3-6 TaxID=2219864 RepID=UPI000DCC0FAF|nr:glycosyltransferase N-terminal domain-containing protein [Sinomicrobium sp. N-1-3-6]RAV29605.1 3-deoxy-D-manno-octulosonic acid transferase [Sinomicrobium sp. N-1-3-6]